MKTETKIKHLTKKTLLRTKVK